MAHNLAIDQASREYSMMYVGESPWHRLGQKIGKDARFDLPAALAAAHLDWNVKAEPLYTVHDCDVPPEHQLPSWVYSGRIRRAPAQAIVRTDNGAHILGIVGSRYTPIQHVDVFQRFTPLVTAKALSINSAGALGQGERVWMLLKLEAAYADAETIRQTNGTADVVKPFVLVSAAHDGSEVVTVCPTAIRVVCQNTLTLTAGDRAAAKVRIRHTASGPAQVADLEDAIQSAAAAYRASVEDMRALAQTPIAPIDAYQYIDDLLPMPARPADPETDATAKTWQAWRNEYSRWTTRRQTAMGLFSTGRGNNGTSFWDAYNSITESIDHAVIAPVTQTGRANVTPQRNASSALHAIQGDGDQLRRAAWTLARQRAGLLVAA